MRRAVPVGFAQLTSPSDSHLRREVTLRLEPAGTPELEKWSGWAGFEPAAPCAQVPPPAMSGDSLQLSGAKLLIRQQISSHDPCFAGFRPGNPGAKQTRSKPGFFYVGKKYDILPTCMNGLLPHG